jgi:PleD family two-component response regulator
VVKPSPNATATPDLSASRGVILVVEDEVSIRKLVRTIFEREGYDVVEAANGFHGLEQASEVIPDLIISDVMMPELDGFGMLKEIRSNPQTREIPIIMLTAKGTTDDIVTGLDLGADDYLAKPFKIPELVARARAKLTRPPVSSELLPRDLKTGLLTENAFHRPLERELERAERTGRPLVLTCLELDELPRLRQRFGPRLEPNIGRQIAELVSVDAQPTDVLARSPHGYYLLLMPEVNTETAARRLDELSQRLASHAFTLGNERLRLTPVIGYAAYTADVDADTFIQQSLTAASVPDKTLKGQS